MATTVQFDLLEQQSGRVTADGYEFDRIAHVTGLSGSGHAKIYAAMTATGMPVIGSAHPTVANCTLSSIDTIEVTQTQVKLRLSYRTLLTQYQPFQEDSIRGGSSVSQVSTNKDINDVDLLLEEEGELPQVGEVTVYRPQVTWSKQKKRLYSPEAEAVYYCGKLNSAVWRGYAAGIWLCTSIDYNSEDGGHTYNTVYNFMMSPFGTATGKGSWQSEYTYRLDNGRAPETLTVYNHKFADEYETANFNTLNL